MRNPGWSPTTVMCPLQSEIASKKSNDLNDLEGEKTSNLEFTEYPNGKLRDRRAFSISRLIVSNGAPFVTEKCIFVRRFGGQNGSEEGMNGVLIIM